LERDGERRTYKRRRAKVEKKVVERNEGEAERRRKTVQREWPPALW
jgi:hypothetical protein